MGDSLPVEHQQVGFCLQLIPGCQHGRTLPERQQTRDVGENERRIVRDALHWSQLGEMQNDNRATGGFFRNAYVNATDSMDRTPVPGKVKPLA